jgi:hypothetical protein
MQHEQCVRSACSGGAMSRLDVTVIVFSALNIMLALPRKERKIITYRIEEAKIKYDVKDTVLRDG